MRFVERVPGLAFDIAPILGVASIIALCVLPIPFVAFAFAKPEERGFGFALAAYWGALALASLLGNFPSPLIGFGASSIVSYLLSWWLLCQNPCAKKTLAGC
jgi:hypothetical protein